LWPAPKTPTTEPVPEPEYTFDQSLLIFDQSVPEEFED
jgi:hypothetical protein